MEKKIASIRYIPVHSEYIAQCTAKFDLIIQDVC
jgi:hypothetical protein